MACVPLVLWEAEGAWVCTRRGETKAASGRQKWYLWVMEEGDGSRKHRDELILINSTEVNKTQIYYNAI